MTKDLLIGIDIGTTSTKSVLVDVQGAVLAQAAHEYATAYPHPNWAEQNPDDWWQAVCITVRQLFADSAHAPTNVAALSVSSQAPTLVPIDQFGNVLHPALIWMDRRSEPQCDWLREHIGQAAIAAVNGGRIDPFFLAPKLLWYRDQRPELYRETTAVLQANGYVVHRLTGQCTMDSSHGALTLLFDGRTEHWSDDLLERVGVDPSILPPVLNCADIVGEVTSAGAKATGLAPGTPVIAGMVDGTAAALEAGVVQPGDAVEMTGQTTVLLVCSDRPYLDDALFPLGHALPDRRLVVGAQVASGGSLRWFRDQIGRTGTTPGRGARRRPLRTTERARVHQPAQEPTGSSSSPTCSANDRPFGTRRRAASTSVSPSPPPKPTSCARLWKAPPMGCVTTWRPRPALGFHARKLACVGGGARSPLWNQIKADILQRPVHVPRAATGAPLGDAIAAAAAAGLYDSVEAAVQGMTSAGVEYRPNPHEAERYDMLYHIYRELYPALRDSFAHLAILPANDSLSRT